MAVAAMGSVAAMGLAAAARAMGGAARVGVAARVGAEAAAWAAAVMAGVALAVESSAVVSVGPVGLWVREVAGKAWVVQGAAVVRAMAEAVREVTMGEVATGPAARR